MSNDITWHSVLLFSPHLRRWTAHHPRMCFCIETSTLNLAQLANYYTWCNPTDAFELATDHTIRLSCSTSTSLLQLFHASPPASA